MARDSEARLIREWRLSLGDTLQEFAQRLDVSISGLSNWELGKAVPSARTKRKIAQKLGLKVEQIIYQGETEDAQKKLAA